MSIFASSSSKCLCFFRNFVIASFIPSIFFLCCSFWSWRFSMSLTSRSVGKTDKNNKWQVNYINDKFIKAEIIAHTGHEKSRMDCINESWNMATISRFGPTVMVIRSPKVRNTYLWYLICSAMSFICTYVLNKHRKGINEIKKQHFECKVHLLHSVNHLAYQNCDHELQFVNWNRTSDNGTGKFVTTKVS